ncbi:MAG: glycerol-3-phosphate dehydrogenase/oxidase [Methylococcaceae bacterium]|nr:MAG: glycerol-3-phosphate dehydrogenase/oxidase [Methylococcaceae bacterium]
MKRDFAALRGRRFDLLVCGGGIYGAWTAYDAALRGLDVALLEQGDWASATSSASSKLIHGGLRYLASLDIKLVKKALAERSLLLRIAPHRVWPLRFGIPVYADSTPGYWRLKAGLSGYDYLAGEPASDTLHRYFDGTAFAQRFAALNTTRLKGGFTYSDAQTDDARLVLELIDGATQAGAVCANYCRATDKLAVHGRICGALAQDRVSGDACEVHARQVVYAVGPWHGADAVSRAWCRLSKGIHLVLPDIGLGEALLLTARADGRVFFLIPWYGRTLLGTTDTDYRGSIDNLVVEEQEAAYLLTAVNAYLAKPFTEADIIGSYAGLRVLKHSGQASLSAVSRDWQLKTAADGAYYSIGGKITSAREDAAVIVDSVCAALGVAVPCRSKDQPLPWAPPGDFEAWRRAVHAQAESLGLARDCTRWLIRRHGRRVADIFHLIGSDAGLAQRIDAELPLLYADLLYCAREEMVVYPADLLRRRLPLSILSRIAEDKLLAIFNSVAVGKVITDHPVAQEIEAFLSAGIVGT